MGGAGLAARARRWACGGSLILALCAPATAEAAPSLLALGTFAEPVHVTGAPGDAARVFVVERRGRVMVWREGVGAQPFLDLTADTLSDSSERGLLSVAFAPDYAASGRVFVYLTVAGGDLQVREYRRAHADGADPASSRVLLTIPHRDASNHNGGQLQFGPDGQLWLATGDGGSTAPLAQDPASLLGKLLKLDVDSGVTTVVAAGLRNPWRFSFDRANGRIVIADVGNGGFEEVHVGLATNYGWPCREGLAEGPTPGDARCAGSTAAPALVKSHGPSGDGFCAITGGYVVRDPGLPTLVGRYLYGDFCQPGLRSADLANPASDVALGLEVPQLSSFGEDACGRLLVASHSGPVYRLVDGAPSACPAPPPPPAPPGVTLDRRACALTLGVSGTRTVRRLKRLTLALRADEPCRATVQASIQGVTRFKPVKASLTTGARAVVRVKLDARGVRAVRAALRRKAALRVSIRVSAVDRAGNKRSLTRTARVRG